MVLNARVYLLLAFLSGRKSGDLGSVIVDFLFCDYRAYLRLRFRFHAKNFQGLTSLTSESVR